MIALTNGRLYTIENGIIEQGTILLDGGKIAEERFGGACRFFAVSEIEAANGMSDLTFFIEYLFREFLGCKISDRFEIGKKNEIDVERSEDRLSFLCR